MRPSGKKQRALYFKIKWLYFIYSTATEILQRLPIPLHQLDITELERARSALQDAELLYQRFTPGQNQALDAIEKKLHQVTESTWLRLLAAIHYLQNIAYHDSLADHFFEHLNICPIHTPNKLSKIDPPYDIIAWFSYLSENVDNTIQNILLQDNIDHSARIEIESSLEYSKNALLSALNTIPTDHIIPKRYTERTKQELKNRLGKIYEPCYQTCKNILFLSNWLNLVTDFYDKMITHIHPPRLASTLRIKHFLFTVKNSLRLQHYEQNHDAQILMALNQYFSYRTDTTDDAPDQILNKLAKKELDLSTTIRSIEKELKQYNLFTHVLSGLIRIFSETTHYQWMDHWLNLSGQLLTKEQPDNTPLSFLHEELHPHYRNIFKHIGAGLLLSLEYRYQQPLRYPLPHSLILSTHRQLTENHDALIDFGKQLHLNEQQILRSIPFLNGLLEFGIQALLRYCWSKERESEFSISLELGAYTVLKLSQQLFKTITYLLSSRATSDKSKQIIQLSSQATGSILSTILHKKTLHSIYRFFHQSTLSDEQLLSESQLCLNNPSPCQKAALKRLGFNQIEKPTARMIRKTWRTLALKTHPDKQPGVAGAFTFHEIAQAKERLVELKAFK